MTWPTCASLRSTAISVKQRISRPCWESSRARTTASRLRQQGSRRRACSEASFVLKSLLCYGVAMNKRLETLLERIPTWPEEAQEDAVMVLSDIEEKIRILRSLSPEDQAKLAALRADIDRAYEQGGSYTDEEVEASIEAQLDEWEQNRKGA